MLQLRFALKRIGWFVLDHPGLYNLSVDMTNESIIIHVLLAAASTVVLYFLLKGRLDKIMANQADFDAQIQAANDKLDAIGTAISDEAKQIADFIANQPASVDTSALQGVVDRLGTVSDSVSGIFTPPAEPTA